MPGWIHRSEQLETALAWQLGVGFCYFTTMTTLQTLLQQVVADSARGRVMSLFAISWAGVVWIGSPHSRNHRGL